MNEQQLLNDSKGNVKAEICCEEEFVKKSTKLAKILGIFGSIVTFVCWISIIWLCINDIFTHDMLPSEIASTIVLLVAISAFAILALFLFISGAVSGNWPEE